MSVSEPAIHPHRPRWRLNRAGILNVYQYDDEILEFAGGRLLLRGVNGSGKSTAMNMLLPFLVTARQNRIDASGEQTGVLKSWMLSGRDEAQPVGYLWIEMYAPGQPGGPPEASAGRYFVCGCGIKANRAADSVTTWWFITDRRPGINLDLVESGVPLSSDALRAELGSDAVYSHAHRREYRAEVQRRLFGGADLEQHLRLLDVVRDPRVGDRIDKELPAHLTNALPELSGLALDQAARPLEDLDEHRQNVSALMANTETLRALTAVYRNYALSDLADRVAAGRERVRACADANQEVSRCRRNAEKARKLEQRLAAEIEQLETDQGRLGEEIDALRSSSAYQEGQQLEGLRDLVRSLGAQRQSAERHVAQLETRRSEVEAELNSAAARAGADRQAVTAEVAMLANTVGAAKLAARVPAPPTLDHRSLPDTTASAPIAAIELETIGSALDALDGSAQLRRGEVGEVRSLVAEANAALSSLQAAERERDALRRLVDEAETAFQETRTALVGAMEAWSQDVDAWVALAQPGFRLSGLPSPLIDRRGAGDQRATPSTAAALRSGLAAEIDTLATHRQRATATARHEVGQTELSRDGAAELVDDLAERVEPDPPMQPWQIRDVPCLADLVDFAPHVSPSDRAGLEAALEASGLLAAGVVAGGLELETGELIVTSNGSVNDPLTSMLTVTVPEHSPPEVDAGLVHKVLESISVDSVSSPAGKSVGHSHAVATVGVDGTFRLGTLAGRHTKSEAEFIGATARRIRLDRLRAEAAEALATAEAELERAQAHHASCLEEQEQAEQLSRSLPPLDALQTAQNRAELAEDALERRRTDLGDGETAVADADSAYAARTSMRDRTAATLQLPADVDGLAQVESALADVGRTTGTTRYLLTALDRSVRSWLAAADRWEALRSEITESRSSMMAAAADHDRSASRLASLEDSLGLPYQEVLASIAVSETDLDAVNVGLAQARKAKEEAVKTEATAAAAERGAIDRQGSVDHLAVEYLLQLRRVLEVPGLIAALAPETAALTPETAELGVADPSGSAADEAADVTLAVPPVADNPAGLAELLNSVAEVAVAPTNRTAADGVRISLRQRRETLGAGWDAEDRQPDLDLPMAVHVEGPLGRMPLAEARHAAEAQLAQLSGLLTVKQDGALRDLLQGLVAREVAEKMDRASRLVKAMNAHLVDVTTAHGIGVELRWRRSPELDGVPDSMIDLLAKLPDLRTEDEEAELRVMLSSRLDEARRLDPERSYRELIAETLDYRRWHDMTVLLRRGTASMKKLTLRIGGELSQGEKKLVTYLPFLAAVAVSCDALAEYAPAAPRFVLLDDAMAKVSEDNHADLLGLVVDLDLDFIATSERLWGTYATVPELSIIEVVRDAELSAILLDRFHWDGSALEQQ